MPDVARTRSVYKPSCIYCYLSESHIPTATTSKTRGLCTHSSHPIPDAPTLRYSDLRLRNVARARSSDPTLSLAVGHRAPRLRFVPPSSRLLTAPLCRCDRPLGWLLVVRPSGPTPTYRLRRPTSPTSPTLRRSAAGLRHRDFAAGSSCRLPTRSLSGLAPDLSEKQGF